MAFSCLAKHPYQVNEKSILSKRYVRIFKAKQSNR